MARDWYEALERSAQSALYEASDWATARIVAESMSRELRPRIVAVTKDGQAVKDSPPITGAALSAYLKAMGSLLVTEGDRRRARVELERPGPELDDGASVTWIDGARARLRDSSS